jgi:uncharacterized membrane protein YcaP (DUF421 family)
MVLDGWFWQRNDDLDAWHMAVRALAMFFVLLACIRFGGARIFSKKSSFDDVVVIALGAVAARGIVGATTFHAAALCCLVIVIVHRLLAFLSVHSTLLERIVKGRVRTLYKDGAFVDREADKTLISKADLEQSLRLETGSTSLDGIHEALLERNGRISFLKK